MSYSVKMRRLLELELPNPPLPGPNTHHAIERHRDNEGGFAQTLSERFPFGLIAKDPPKSLQFQWGGENFDFLDKLIWTDQKMHDIHREWALTKEMDRRVYERQVRKDMEEQIYYYLQDHHRFLIDIEKTRDFWTHKWAVQKLFDRVGDRFFDNRAHFIGEIIEGHFKRQDNWRLWERKMKNNPFDSRLKWPAVPSLVTVERQDAVDKNEKTWDIRNAYHQNSAIWMDTHRAKLEAMMEMHKKHFGVEPKFEKTLIDKRPGHAAYGLNLEHNMGLGVIKVGAPPVNSDD